MNEAILVYHRQQNLGRRFGASKWYIKSSQWLRLLAVLRGGFVNTSLFIVAPIGSSVIGLCFLIVSFIVLL